MAPKITYVNNSTESSFLASCTSFYTDFPWSLNPNLGKGVAIRAHLWAKLPYFQYFIIFIIIPVIQVDKKKKKNPPKLCFKWKGVSLPMSLAATVLASLRKPQLGRWNRCQGRRRGMSLCWRSGFQGVQLIVAYLRLGSVACLRLQRAWWWVLGD